MLKANQLKFLELATDKFGAEAVVPVAELVALAEANNLSNNDHHWLYKPTYRSGRAQYKLPAYNTDSIAAMAADIVPIRKDVSVAPKKFDPNAISEHDYAQIPAKDKHYVPFGEFKMIEKIVASGKFFPVFISGHSGNGKTFMVEQVCAKVKRPMIRVQMSRETDEDDLIGGFRLINGETKFMKGPVLRAMEIGALLLIDEAEIGRAHV